MNDEDLSTIWQSSQNCEVGDVLAIKFSSQTDIGTMVLIPGDTTKTLVEIATGSNLDHDLNSVAISTTNDMVAPVFDENILYITIKIESSGGWLFSLREILVYENIHIGSNQLYGTTTSAWSPNFDDIDYAMTEYEDSDSSPTVIERFYSGDS